MSLSERLNEHPLLHWIADNTKNFVYLVLIIVSMGVLTYRLMSYWSSQAGYHYGTAENDFAEFKAQKGVERSATVEGLLQTIEIQPDLQPIYDGKLGQTLLSQGDERAIPLIERAIARTGEAVGPLFSRYVENTLLIARGDYPAALKGSQELQTALLDQENAGILLPLNLLRIAMLQNRLGKESLKTWAAWDELEKQNVYFQDVAAIFREAKVDLKAYRENILK